jgi:hypothetical protein
MARDRVQWRAAVSAMFTVGAQLQASSFVRRRKGRWLGVVPSSDSSCVFIDRACVCRGEVGEQQFVSPSPGAAVTCHPFTLLLALCQLPRHVPGRVTARRGSAAQQNGRVTVLGRHEHVNTSPVAIDTALVT